MASNRLLIFAGANSCRFASATPARFLSTSTEIQQIGGLAVKTQDQENPGFLQKLSMRLNGIPLKGETHPPKSAFDDCDKEYVVAEPPAIPKDFKEYPERDIVNFPYPARHAYPPKTRMFIIPDSWCAPFHKVTGTSGPYLFFGGVALFLNAKEIFVMDENAMKVMGFAGMYFWLSRIWQYQLDKFLHKKFTEKVDEYKGLIAEDLKDAVEFRKSSAAEAESLKEVQENFPTIFKENLQLQLEAVYRKNVETVASELKRRIDYLQEVEATKLRFERDILLKSITEGVQKQIASNEGNIKDQYLNNCILQLKSLAA